MQAFSDLRKLFQEKHKTAPRPRPNGKSAAEYRFGSVKRELLKEMMAVDPKDRPETDKIITRLQAEKQPPVDIEKRIEEYVCTV